MAAGAVCLGFTIARDFKTGQPTAIKAIIPTIFRSNRAFDHTLFILKVLDILAEVATGIALLAESGSLIAGYR